MYITTQIDNILDNYYPTYNTKVDKAKTKLLNADLSIYDNYSAEELVQAVLDEMDLLLMLPPQLKKGAIMKRISLKQARLLSLSVNVWAIFKLCNDGRECTNDNWLAYRELCDADFWADENANEFRFYID